MVLIFEYQPKRKVLKMLSDSVLEIQIFKNFPGGGMPPDPPSMACFACCVLCTHTIPIISPEMDTVCYTFVLFIMFCSPHIYYVLWYTLKLAPPSRQS